MITRDDGSKRCPLGGTRQLATNQDSRVQVGAREGGALERCLFLQIGQLSSEALGSLRLPSCARHSHLGLSVASR